MLSARQPGPETLGSKRLRLATNARRSRSSCGRSRAVALDRLGRRLIALRSCAVLRGRRLNDVTSSQLHADRCGPSSDVLPGQERLFRLAGRSQPAGRGALACRGRRHRDHPRVRVHVKRVERRHRNQSTASPPVANHARSSVPTSSRSAKGRFHLVALGPGSVVPVDHHGATEAPRVLKDLTTLRHRVGQNGSSGWDKERRVHDGKGQFISALVSGSRKTCDVPGR